MSMIAGRELREEREKKNIPLEKVSEDLFIRITYLQAIENGRPEILPSVVQGRGFVRMYAEYLKLDPMEILKLWDNPSSAEDALPIEHTQPIPMMDSAAPRAPLAENLAEPVPTTGANTAETDPVQAIFNEIGSELKTRRESLSLTYDDAETHTLVRGIYLKAMETGDFDALPSSVQARGMLNNYAAFLNLNVDDIMLRFANALQLQTASRAIENPELAILRKDNKQKPVRKVGKLRQFITPDLFVGLTVLIGMAAIIIYSAVTVAEYKNRAVQATANMNQLYLNQLATLAVTVTPTSPAATPTTAAEATLPIAAANVNPAEEGETEVTEVTETLPVAEGGLTTTQPIQVYIESNQRAFLRVVSDGNVVFTGRTLPGNTYPFDASELLEVTTGNAAALSILYNQQRMGTLGLLGQVVSLEFTRDMILTPTPMFSPTPTATAVISATPEPLIQFTPTSTITPYIP